MAVRILILVRYVVGFAIKQVGALKFFDLTCEKEQIYKQYNQTGIGSLFNYYTLYWTIGTTIKSLEINIGRKSGFILRRCR